MKKNMLIIGSLVFLSGLTHANAQSGSAQEPEVINQLSSSAAISSMSVSALLKASGNEALKAFFFTPVKNKTALKGKELAVLAADGFEEIELQKSFLLFRKSIRGFVQKLHFPQSLLAFHRGHGGFGNCIYFLQGSQ